MNIICFMLSLFECCIGSLLFIGYLSFLFSLKHIGCYDRTKSDRATSIPGAAQFGKRCFPCEQAPNTRRVASFLRPIALIMLEELEGSVIIVQSPGIRYTM